MRISDWSSDVCSSDLDRDGYPVLEGKIDGLLSALAHARTTYASTKETLNYAEYGLSGINHLAQTATAAATPVTVTLTDGQGKRMAHVEIGRESSRARVCQ